MKTSGMLDREINHFLSKASGEKDQLKKELAKKLSPGGKLQLLHVLQELDQELRSARSKANKLKFLAFLCDN